MELIRLACPLLRSSPFESVMDWFNFFGDGLVAGGIGVALLACGLVARASPPRSASWPPGSSPTS